MPFSFVLEPLAQDQIAIAPYLILNNQVSQGVQGNSAHFFWILNVKGVFVQHQTQAFGYRRL